MIEKLFVVRNCCGRLLGVFQKQQILAPDVCQECGDAMNHQEVVLVWRMPKVGSPRHSSSVDLSSLGFTGSQICEIVGAGGVWLVDSTYQPSNNDRVRGREIGGYGWKI